jgi:membrane fusion protein (multidrug efflux system)
MTESTPEPAPRRRLVGMPSMILLGALGGLLGVGGVLYMRAASDANQVALASQPKPVTATVAKSQPFQPSRRYVGTIEPWLSANIGPQMVSAYVDTVLVRPGDVVKRGSVLATLDCRNASAMSRVVAAQARAIDAMHTASANEASRVASLLDGKYVSQNEVDQKKAEAASKEAQFAALQAQAIGTSLQVDDCVLRSPFDGEIATRTSDPGAFVRPGSSISTVIDRHMVRITAEVPEDDFDAVPPGTPVRIHLVSTGKDLTSRIARRAPAADPGTRTTHIEIDVDNADHSIPVWTTAELSLDVGTPIPATALPLPAATVHAGKARVFVVDKGVAHLRRAPVIGEREGVLYVDPKALPGGSQVVTEGRNLLDDGEAVAAKVEQ